MLDPLLRNPAACGAVRISPRYFPLRPKGDAVMGVTLTLARSGQISEAELACLSKNITAPVDSCNEIAILHQSTVGSAFIAAECTEFADRHGRRGRLAAGGGRRNEKKRADTRLLRNSATFNRNQNDLSLSAKIGHHDVNNY
ncbi:MAG: hypothetical protein ABSD59_11680 [Terracidiphilus sp.]